LLGSPAGSRNSLPANRLSPHEFRSARHIGQPQPSPADPEYDLPMLSLRPLTARFVRFALPMLALAAMAAPVIAQTAPKVEKVLKPAVPPVGKSDIPWMPYIMAVLFAIIIIAVNFIPSKRGHQD
jgi:hypothetical protein